VLVQKHQHTARQNDAKGIHGILVAVFIQQADLFAFDVRDGALEIADRPADIPRVVLIMDGGHLARFLITKAERHTLRKALFHIQGDQIIYVVQHLDHYNSLLMFIPCCIALCSVYNIFQCNAILSQHLIP
jgi:hypothetical protein